MALLPKKPYINIKRACKELNCSIDDLVDCWLSNELDFYYMLQGEKVTIYLQKNDHDFQSKIFMYAANAYDNENTKIYLNKANQEVIKGKAYGAFLISPMRSTYTVQDSINIITREKVLER